MTIDLSLTELQRAYRSGDLTPEQVLAEIDQRAEAAHLHNVWIYRLSVRERQPYIDALQDLDPQASPLWGVPFAIKDNIDLQGVPTTAACEPFAYTPQRSAQVVENLLAAGAIPVGKTNLDQFATGLNGTRSPYGVCRNSFDRTYISGGSSSGSAVAVALGLASFSLGTDTAGSGRVPACFNNLVGVKTTRGLLSNRGVVPACRSLDTVSLFTLTADDGNAVLAAAERFDRDDPYSRRNHHVNTWRYYGARSLPLTAGVIPEAQLAFFDDKEYARAYDQALQSLRDAGVSLVELDYTPFNEAAQLLYQGPWVAERFIATESVLRAHSQAMHPVVREIVAAGENIDAVDVFRAQYHLASLQQRCAEQVKGLDCLLTPTAGRLFTIDEMLESPVERNTQLGYYTNFMNLLDMAAVSVPTGFTQNGLPFGVTIAGPAFSDRRLLSIANALQRWFPLPLGCRLGTTPELNSQPVTDTRAISVVVAGAHLSGLPLNWQLTERGATLHCAGATAENYRLYALPGGPPLRPALVRDDAGRSIDVEVWRVPAEAFGSFVAAIPAPLGIGTVELIDGSQHAGFICEAGALDGAEDVTRYGSWRAYVQSLAQ